MNSNKKDFASDNAADGDEIKKAVKGDSEKEDMFSGEESKESNWIHTKSEIIYLRWF